MISFGKTCKSDAGPELHDNPWNCWTLVLWGSLIEHTFDHTPWDGQPLPAITARKRGFLSFKYLKAEQAHRIEVPRAAWVLLWHGKARRATGVWTEVRATIGEIVQQYQDKIITFKHHGLVGLYNKSEAR